MEDKLDRETLKEILIEIVEWLEMLDVKEIKDGYCIRQLIDRIKYEL